MLDRSILPQTLQDFKYYTNKLPMFLQQSAGFIEHFRIWYDILVGRKTELNNTSGVVGSADTLFNLLNIFDQEIDSNGNITSHYLTFLNSLPNSDEGYASDILDKLGALFGVTRQFEVQYTNHDGLQTRNLVLSNEEFLLLIKIQIVRNYCEGTYEQIKAMYESVALYVYITTSSEPAKSIVYLADFSGENAYTSSDNVQAMFFAGLLTIESMGIEYTYALVNLDELLIWSLAADTSSEPIVDNHGWSDESGLNGGVWVA